MASSASPPSRPAGSAPPGRVHVEDPRLVPPKRAGTAHTSAAPASVSFAGPLGFVRCVTPTQSEEIVARLYADAVRVRQQRSPPPPQSRPTSALSEDEIKESVDRLYYGGVRHKQESHKKLIDRYAFRPVRNTTDLSKKELCERVVERFYTEERARQHKRAEELRRQYIATTEPHVALRSRDEIRFIVDRLSKKE